MSNDELLARLDNQIENSKVIGCECPSCDNAVALRAVVELHNARGGWIFQGVLQDQFCGICDVEYPCPTIQAIEKELK